MTSALDLVRRIRGRHYDHIVLANINDLSEDEAVRLIEQHQYDAAIETPQRFRYNPPGDPGEYAVYREAASYLEANRPQSKD